MLGSHRILIGDVREQLKLLAPASVHCAVSSPPYWALRDYGVAGQIGSEATPDEFVQTLVGVFDRVRSVLREDGTLWMNLGDTYNAHPGQRKTTDKAGSKQLTNTGSNSVGSRSVRGLEAGQQMLMPHRVAMAMQAAGWFLRSTIVWAKRSPMPESISGWRWVPCRVRDPNHSQMKYEGKGTGQDPQSASERMKMNVATARANGASHDTGAAAVGSLGWQPCPGCPKCSATSGLVLRRGKWRPTTAHEYVFLFSKSERYFADGDAIQEAAQPASKARQLAGFKPSSRDDQNNYGDGFMRGGGFLSETRNPRSVWTLSSEPYKGSHFATFPSELAKRCILAGTSAGGCCASCGSPHAPVVVSERVATRPGEDCKILTAHAHRTDIDPATNWQNSTLNYGNRDPQRHVARSTITGYRATCGCNAGVVPCTVLDPFLGSGTTVQVATHYGRDGIGIELNPEYAALAEARIATPPRCLILEQEKAGKKAAKRRKPMDAQGNLF